MREGSLSWIFADETTLVYRRQHGSDTVDIALHFGADATTLALEDTSLPGAEVALASGTARFTSDTATLGEASALVRTRGGAEARDRALRTRRNLAVWKEDVEEGRAATLSRPTRIDFAVTERCNLRCQHCITHAPEKTKTGTARTLASETLAAMHEDLAISRYFGFVHGGETLTAPIFWDVLAAIDGKRTEEPPMIHLLSNGMLLTEATTARRVPAGVRSVSVSLDGASAATNDLVRDGGSFEAIASNLRAMAKTRAREKIDLRLGISTVVLRQNVDELDRMVDLALDLGLDWLKLEEAVASTPFAARSLIAASDAALRAAVDRARRRGEAGGLVIVDHITDPARFVCRMAEHEAEAHAADEFANRARINACATPWETACIEPSGEVRLGDFFGPILGRIGETTMVELWNAPEARALREKSRAERICERVSCL